MSARTIRTALWAAGSGALAVLAAVVSLRLTSDALGLPWGRGTWQTGDAALMYMLASTMIRFGWISLNPDVGLPDGMDLGHIPLAETHQWLLLKAVSVFTDDPIVALNVFFLAGFFAVGFASFLLLDATLKVRWMALALGVALATLPWHYSRFHHTLLADYSPVPVFLLLAFLMWTDRFTQSRSRLALGLVGAIYVGTSGVYYAFFACLILGPVLICRLAVQRRFRLWWRDALIVAVIPVTMAASLVAHRSLASSEVSGTSLVERVPLMSLGFAGLGPSLLTPWPFSDSEEEGAAQFSVLVAVAFLTALVALVAFTIASIRGRLGPQGLRLHGELKPWFLLLIWSLIWFIPGMGYLFALAVTPEIRSWGRLSLVVGYIAVVIFGLLLGEVVRRGDKARLIAASGLVVLLGLQVALDHRPLTIPERSSRLDLAGRTYAAEVKDVLDDGCPILQLPALEFPEEWREEWEDVGISAYDHMWVQLYAPEFRWSFGAPRGTAGAVTAQARYGQDVSEALVLARADGFCAVHVDTRGLSDEEQDEIQRVLGDPQVVVGQWALYPLRTPDAQGSGG